MLGRWIWLAALVVPPASAAAASGERAEEERADTDEDTKPSPANRTSAKILARLQAIEENLETTRYQHHTVVRRKEGLYAWDCSGMANWILRRVHPRAFDALGRDRPVARTYWRVISKAPTTKRKRGWRRLQHIEDVRPGDVFAWVRPPDWPKGGNTGHIGFALDVAHPVEGIEGAYTLRIADATSLPHQDDTRRRGGDGGFGQGTLMFMINEGGDAWAYGWFGTNSRGVIPTNIVFGRVGR
jgi:hypothetical protein